jgi:hypothetical protein
MNGNSFIRAIGPFSTVAKKRNAITTKLGSPSITILVLTVAMVAPRLAFGYATFAHEELIDLAWNNSIRPLLLERYPGTTEIGLREAHAFAYGGCLIQDLGYYPFGKELFSDLTHYVRSGDFVIALLRDARNVNEFAFAIGALSHYVGDSIGHSQGINPSTAITFPDLEKRYGPIVTFEEDPTAHVRTEFGFDVAQTAFFRYAPYEYRKRVGFRVSRAVLERAYYETYGLTVRSILGPPIAAMGSYRVGVRRVIPLFAKATIVNVRCHLPPDQPGPALQQLLASISKTDYATNWSRYQHGPALKDDVLGIIVRLIPKIGILKILAIKPPSARTEELFLKSLNVALTQFQTLLAELSKSPSSELALANRDLDTGSKVRPGAYRRTDRAYAELLHKVTAKPGLPIPPGLREDILAYYADPAAPISTKQNRRAWKKVLAQLQSLEQQALADSRNER